MILLILFAVYVFAAVALGVSVGLQTGWRDGLKLSGGIMGGVLFVAGMYAPFIAKNLQALGLI